MVAAFLLLWPRLVSSFASFRSGEPWLDTDGNIIDAHGGGLLVDGGRYYWYGSQRNGWKCCHDGGINLYSSADLYNWAYEGRVISSFNGALDQTTQQPGQSLSTTSMHRQVQLRATASISSGPRWYGALEGT